MQVRLSTDLAVRCIALRKLGTDNLVLFYWRSVRKTSVAFYLSLVLPADLRAFGRVSGNQGPKLLVLTTPRPGLYTVRGPIFCSCLKLFPSRRQVHRYLSYACCFRLEPEQDPGLPLYIPHIDPDTRRYESRVSTVRPGSRQGPGQSRKSRQHPLRNSTAVRHRLVGPSGARFHR